MTGQEWEARIKQSVCYTSGKAFSRKQVCDELGTTCDSINWVLNRMATDDKLTKSQKHGKTAYRRRTFLKNWISDAWGRTLTNEQVTGEPEYSR